MPENGLTASWELAADARDVSGGGHHAIARGPVVFAPSHGSSMARPVTAMRSQGGHLEVPSILGLGRSDFTLAAWVHASTR